MQLLAATSPFGSPQPGIFELGMLGPGVILNVIKVGYILSFAMLTLFGLVLIRQISLMNTTVTTPNSGLLRLISYVYLIVTSLAFLLSFVIL